MKKIYFLVLSLCVFNGVNAQFKITIPDANFKAKLLEANTSNTIAIGINGDPIKIDTNSDGLFDYSELLNVYKLTVDNSAIASLSGIEYFKNITTLNCEGNKLVYLGIYGLFSLTYVNCQSNLITSINFDGLTNLETLECGGNQISELNLTFLTKLKNLDCGGNLMTSLNLSGLTDLESLGFANNQVTSINVSQLIKLKSLYCGNNQLSSLNLNGLSNLTTLWCFGNQLTSLDLKQLNNLQDLWCQDNQLTSLFIKNGSNENFINISNNPNLKFICADDIQLTQVQNLISTQGYTNCILSNDCNDISDPAVYIPDVNFKTKLLLANLANSIATDNNGNPMVVDANGDGKIQLSEALKVSNLYLNNFEISNLTGIQSFINLVILQCTDNKLTSLDVSKLTNLDSLYCSSNSLTNLNVTGLSSLTSLGCDENQLTSLNLTGVNNLYVLACNDNQLTGLDLTGISNLNILQCQNNQISTLDLSNQTASLTSLDCYNNNLVNLTINNLGQLSYLECSNNQLIELDLTGLDNLMYLFCSNNQITSLNVVGSTELTYFNCNLNKISSLDFTGLSNLIDLDCGGNQLSTIDVTQLPELKYLGFWKNEITTIDLSNSTNLEELYAGHNPLLPLDYSKMPNLQKLWIGYTPITSLDLSALKNLNGINVSNCPNLEFISLKNGIIEDLTYLEVVLPTIQLDGNNFSNCPKLQYICADEDEIDTITQKIAGYNYTNCVVGNYCSYNPGGVNYTIQGNNRIDSNNNGCDALDFPVSNMKFSFSDGTATGTLISDATENYSLKVREGDYTITPILENPTYFNVSPTIVNISFPTQASPFNQDFCVTANGSHPDLEIALLPLQPARPGFDATYKIVYKNKGNVAQSGNVNLNFNDAVLDFVVANPVISSQTMNNLSWNFTNLKPFETKEITFTLIVNAPTETPAVNSGFVLAYKATITSAATEETPMDNTFDFNQTVVNSFDPNDKTCLEGTTISSSLIGQYVHYMIRFENNGTYKAQNIVIKDMIDLSKFDISTLIPTNASHPFVTNISNGSKVEFIFENINLPFDDANNDGYIAFKIKTKPTLAIGDSFTNEANIFFDYNFPIVTNKATSTFKTLGMQDFEFSSYFSIYPNPANEILNIAATKEIEVKSIAVYDILGQIVLALPNVKVSKIDVSSLKTGNYFIKINSDKGSSSTKFIKN